MTSPTLLVMYVARGAGTRLQDLVEELSAESGARRAGGDRLFLGSWFSTQQT